MITTNSDGQPLSAAYATAIAQPMVSYDMRLYQNGADTGYGIKRAQLEFGAGYSAVDDLGTFSPGQLYQTQFGAQLYDLTGSIVGDELEVRIGVDTGSGYEYVTVAWVTVTSSKTWAGVTEVSAVGRMAKMQAPHGLAGGDYSPAEIAAAVLAATGVQVAVGGFSRPQSAHVDAGGTCRDALASLCARLGGYACELGSGVSVLPYSSATTCQLIAENMTAAPEIGQQYVVDGITVSADDGSYSFGSGRVAIEDPTATAETAALTWANLQGYSYTPATLTTAIIDPRVTVADVLSLTIGSDSYAVPARGISATFDGGWFGSYCAAGLTAEAEEAVVEGPVSSAARAAEEAASAAQAVANAVNQHFWTDGSGVHVTEVTQEEWQTSPSGANQLSNSQGILLRDGLTNFAQLTPGETAFYDGAGNAASNVVATFGTSGSVIGKAAESHAFIDYHSMQMVDKHGDEYFNVSDLRDRTGLATITETFTGDGTTTAFVVGFLPTSNALCSVEVEGTPVAWTRSNPLSKTFTLSSAPADGDTVTITYKTGSSEAKALTFGVRGSGSVGGMSTAEGRGVVASGLYSHAGGYFTIAQGTNQTALGRYNVADPTSALIIGNGTSGARSNALTVDWSGNVDAAGTATLGTPLAIASGGTGADNATDAAANLRAVRYASGQAAQFQNYAGTAHQWGISAECVNANNTSYYGKRSGLIVRNDGLSLYDPATSSSIWQLNASPTPDESTPSLTGATAASFAVRRVSGVATIYVNAMKVSTQLASGSQVQIATLPAGYRPAYTTGMPLTSSTANAARGVWLYVTAGGNVSIYNRSGNALSTSANLYCAGTYVL